MGGPEMAPQLVQARGLRPLGLPGQRSGRPGGAVAPLDPRRSGQPGGAVTPLDRALEAAARARVTLILGTSDTGKTSLTARLAGALAAGPLALALKRAKVRAADPDLVLVLQRSDESEPIARALERDVRPRVVRLAPSPAVVRRSAARRREHRERALRDYLAHAAT